MQKTNTKQNFISIISDEIITGKIYYIRGKKVMFDRDLAELYGVETKTLNRAVKRNVKRFPDDFMFQLNEKEAEIMRYQIGSLEKNENLRYQNGTSSYGGRRYKPYVFTEQGVMMLSAVLKSNIAIEVSIQIVRVFMKLREMLATHKELRDKIEKMELKYNDNFKTVFKVIAKLMAADPGGKELRVIGFEDNRK